MKAAFFATCLLCASLHAGELDDKPASAAIPVQSTYDCLVAAIRGPHEDFRWIMCAYKELQSRIERRVAAVPFSKRGKEFTVSDNETVGSLLGKCGEPNMWRTSWQPQIRLITKDAIYQSPSSFDARLKEAFLKREVKPGDILIEGMIE